MTINYWFWIVLIVYFTVCFIVDCVEDLAYLIPMFSLVSLLFSCSTCSKSTKSKKPNGNISTDWAKVLSFVWEKVLFYTEVTFSCWQPFRKRFSNFRSNRLNITAWNVFSVFYPIRNVYGDLWSKSRYSVRARENTDQKKTPYLDTFHAMITLLYAKLRC